MPETLPVPLYARAVESRRKHPILEDPWAVGMVESVDWYFLRFLLGHPEGTVVEIGSGLNTRFERIDNGRLRWFDLDLPEVVELRRRFFSDTERRRTMASSVVDGG